MNTNFAVAIRRALPMGDAGTSPEARLMQALGAGRVRVQFRGDDHRVGERAIADTRRHRRAVEKLARTVARRESRAHQRQGK